MIDYLALGPTPCSEDCQQIGMPDYDSEKDTADLRRYKAMLEKRWPAANFAIKSFPHDFGTYREVVVYFDSEQEDPIAYTVEANLPEKWDSWQQPLPLSRQSL